MRIIQKAQKDVRYHDLKCDFITVNCKAECGHCRSDGTSDGYHTCDRCNGHRWLWASTEHPGYGFTPYTLASVYF